jgi:hypothetical protein
MGMTCRIREVAPGDVAALAAPPKAGCDLFARGCERVLSLEKAWDGLHYLLTGVPVGGEEPLCFLRRGGKRVGRNLGYGRPRLLDAEFVQRLDAALQEISEEQLWARFDADRFTAIARRVPGLLRGAEALRAARR